MSNNILTCNMDTTTMECIGITWIYVYVLHVFPWLESTDGNGCKVERPIFFSNLGEHVRVGSVPSEPKSAGEGDTWSTILLFLLKILYLLFGPTTAQLPQRALFSSRRVLLPQ